MKPAQTPFHQGELALQEKLGVKDMVGSYAPHVIRDHMPDQHREFFSSLPYFMMGSVDQNGMPWASMLWGEPGFVASPDARSLTISTLPTEGDPLFGNLALGAEIGMVGIELHTRRRNRVNGRVAEIMENGFSVNITQSFGNCPQYIQARKIDARVAEHGNSENLSETVTKARRLSQSDKALVNQADTFFIASASGDLGADERHGVDMSHRGGAPGFVKILENGSLLVPDFSGNNHYNTLGNITVNPVAGLLFADFETGDILQMTGEAEIIWPPESRFHYDGALRYLQITPEAVVRRAGALPYRWSAAEMSPVVPASEWRTVPEAKQPSTDSEMTVRVTDIIDEAEGIKSFYLNREDGAPLSAYKPGQHLPIAVTVGSDTLRRTYTLSAAPGKAALRLTVKRDGSGSVSRFLHDSVTPGATLTARAPAGSFFLQEQRDRPVVLLSAGVGITPMMAMAETLLAEGETAPEIFFIHGSKSPTETPFLGELRRWAQQHANFTLQLRFSAGTGSDLSGFQAASYGRIDANLLKNIDISEGADYYLCGPAGFMQGVYEHLTSVGIAENRIFAEAFGPSSLVRKAAKPKKTFPPQAVEFRRSGVKTTWNASEDTLLELAEYEGIDAPFSCRSGNCGSCETVLISGATDYETQPAYAPQKDKLLLCCARPELKSSDPLVIDI